LKAKLLLDEGRPKVEEHDLKEVVEKAGMKVDGHKADIGIVVGGDGIFSYYGRIETVPLLFVGVRSKTATGSKAYLAETYFDELHEALSSVVKGSYQIQEYRRLDVLVSGRHCGEVFTDVYLQRGAESNCLRYRVKVDGRGTTIDESAIGDGIVVTTSAGASGYYSYPDKIQGGMIRSMEHTSIGLDEIGLCHIVPTFATRRDTSESPLRYNVPWGSAIELAITRPADARLYGVGSDREGIKVKMRDKITIRSSDSTTKVVSLGA
jgi:hypothetical protein